MTEYRVVSKRIVSPDGQVIAEAKSVVTSGDNQTETTQNVSVNVSSNSNSSNSSSSSSSKS